MKKIFAIILTAFTFYACKKMTFETAPAYEKAAITAVELYNATAVRADQKAVIDTTAGTIMVTLKPGQDITRLKLDVTASTGAKVTPSMSVGLQDLSAPKTYRVTSPGGTVSKDWTITVTP